MTRGVSWFFVAPLVALGLSGCNFSFEQREPWRAEAEEKCVAEGLVKSSAYTTAIRSIDGRGTCGMERPFKVSGLGDGTVAVSPAATLACPVTASLNAWVAEGIQPAAMAWFGQPVVEIKQMSAYSCRNMNGAATGKVSEHAFGNALDIGSFVLADGRVVSVQRGWKGQADERGFLRTVQATACDRFTTVLAPGSNVYHYNHIHVDLMRRSSGRGICKPAPQMPTPPRLPNAPLMSGAPYPQSSYPAPGYPPPVTPAAAPMPEGEAMEGEELPPDYNHGVDPSYQPPGSYPPAEPEYAPSRDANTGYPGPAPYPAQQPAGYPAQAPGYLPPMGMPAARGYPANPGPAYPAQPSYPRPSGPLPPAGVPLVKWQKGADPAVTGSATRSYAPEAPARRSPFGLIEPIELPEAVPGED